MVYIRKTRHISFSKTKKPKDKYIYMKYLKGLLHGLAEVFRSLEKIGRRGTIVILSFLGVIVFLVVFGAFVFIFQQEKTIKAVKEVGKDVRIQQMNNMLDFLPNMLSEIQLAYKADGVGFVVYEPTNFYYHAKLFKFRGDETVLNPVLLDAMVRTTGMKDEIQHMVTDKNQWLRKDYKNPFFLDKVKSYVDYPVFTQLGVFFGSIFVFWGRDVPLWAGCKDPKNCWSHLLMTDLRQITGRISGSVYNPQLIIDKTFTLK